MFDFNSLIDIKDIDSINESEEQMKIIEEKCFIFAVVAHKKGFIKVSKEAFKDSFEYSDNVESFNVEALFFMGLCELKLNNLKEAKSIFCKLLCHFIKDCPWKARTHCNLASCFAGLILNDYDKAIEHYNKSIEISQKLGLKRLKKI